MHLVVLYTLFSGHTFQTFTKNKGITRLLEGIYIYIFEAIYKMQIASMSAVLWDFGLLRNFATLGYRAIEQ